MNHQPRRGQEREPHESDNEGGKSRSKDGEEWPGKKKTFIRPMLQGKEETLGSNLVVSEESRATHPQASISETSEGGHWRYDKEEFLSIHGEQPEVSVWGNWSPPWSKWRLLSGTVIRHKSVCNSCQEGYHNAQRHSTGQKIVMQNWKDQTHIQDWGEFNSVLSSIENVPGNGKIKRRKRHSQECSPIVV